MDAGSPSPSFPALRRQPTHIPGLDTVLNGGMLTGDVYLVAGEPGTGKTTLGNHLAFAHAAAGGNVLFATLLSESHDRMLAHLQGLQFVDSARVGEQIHYVSLLTGLQEGGVEAMLRTLVDTIRTYTPTLLVIDSAGASRTLTTTDFDFGHFIHALQARAMLHGCTTVLLASAREAELAARHVDGLIRLSNDSIGTTDVRSLRVVKLRGSAYLHGLHTFAIDTTGIAVFPRLESVYSRLLPQWTGIDRLSLGVAGLDAMTGDGVLSGSSATVLGTPGSGKTLLGLHFLAEGVRQGEPCLLAGFQETPSGIASTADRVGLELAPHLASGLLRVMWRPPLDFTPDD